MYLFIIFFFFSHRAILNRETVNNMMTIIQPSLFAFELSKPPTAVLLDVASITKERILVLDTFFRLIVHHGETIAIWREQGLQTQPEYAHFKELLESPISEAEQILAERFPSPQVLVCDQNSSQARFLVSQLNNSISQQSGDDSKTTQAVPILGGSKVVDDKVSDSPMLFSDDVTLKKFLEVLKKLVTEKK
jgi:protein transport protein SEC23